MLIEGCQLLSNFIKLSAHLLPIAILGVQIRFGSIMMLVCPPYSSGSQGKKSSCHSWGHRPETVSSDPDTLQYQS